MLVALSAASLLLTSGGGAAAAPLRTELQLTSLTPISAQLGSTVRAKGTFASNKTIDSVVIRLEVGTTAFFSRSAITEAAANPPDTSAVFGAQDDLGKVRRGDREEFTVAVPADDLPFFNAGVFPLRIVAVDARTGAELSSTSTFLPWAPYGVGGSASRLLMFWPLVGVPVRDSTGAVVDNSLAASTAAGGRLSTLLDSGADAPATWVVDPALLDDAASIGTASADQWVESFGSAAETREVLALPYGDPDVAAVASAGVPRLLRQAQAKGDRVYGRLTEATPRSDLSWPADGAGDDGVIATSARSGDAFVLLNEENAPLITPLTYTPSGRIAWEDPAVDVLLADAPASALVASPADTTSDVLLARQRFLAETLLHALEIPDPTLLVVAPPRRWDPSELWADELVTAIRRAPWLNPVSLDEAVRPSAPVTPRAAPTIPTGSLERQLPDAMVTAAEQGIIDNRRLGAILTRPRQLSTPIEDALLTSVSTAWRANVTAAEASQGATLDRLSAQRSRVRIVSQGGTLGDDTGSFPVTIRNQLDQPVVVRLAVTSTDPLRLRVEGPQDRIRIAPARSTSVEVALDAVTSGRLSFDAQLRTPLRGAAYDDPVTLAVDVRGFGQITFVVFGVAVALLVVAAAIRIFRRVRAARQAAS